MSLYYIDVSNYIVANSGDVYHTTSSYGYNMESIAFYGVELEFNTILAEKLTLFGNYTYRKTEYDNDDLLADAVLLELAPEHKANLGIRYQLFEKTLLTSDIRYMGKRESEGKVYTLDAFTTVDVGIQQKLFSNTRVLVYANNIFGEEYQEVYGYPLPEHGYGVNVKITF